MIVQALDGQQKYAVVSSVTTGPAFVYAGGMRAKFGTCVDV
jgi:hypothetical protein